MSSDTTARGQPMARDDEAREGDETTVIHGGDQAWSTVDQPAEIRDPAAGGPPAADFAGPWQPLAGTDEARHDYSSNDASGYDDPSAGEPTDRDADQESPRSADGAPDSDSGDKALGAVAPENRLS